MRVGEILGLTWDCVDISEDAIRAGTACVRINKELKRCQKDSLAALERRGRSTVLLTFPEWKADRIINIAGTKGSKNGKQCAEGISAENRFDGAHRGER